MDAIFAPQEVVIAREFTNDYTTNNQFGGDAMRNFDGKTIAITSIGPVSQGIAHAFIEAGAVVCVTHAKLGNAEAIADQLGPNARAVKLDPANPLDIERFIEFTNRQGGIDALINHFHASDIKPFLDVTATDIDGLFSLIVKPTLLVLQAVARQMITLNRRGSIINRLGQGSSSSAFKGDPLCAMPVACNAALISLTRSAALALAGAGIRVNAIAPGPTSLPLWAELDAAYKRLEPEHPTSKSLRLKQSVPLGRLATPADLVGASLFLASSESEFITGAVIAVDGGLSLT